MVAVAVGAMSALPTGSPLRNCPAPRKRALTRRDALLLPILWSIIVSKYSGTRGAERDM